MDNRAPRDDNFWTVLTYEALAFVRRGTAYGLPDDHQHSAVHWPSDIAGYRFLRAPKPVDGRVLVNQDAHLFGVVNRSHRLAPYLVHLLTPLYAPLVSGTPFEHLQADTWRCPQDGCAYYEDTDNLSAAAVRAIRDVQPTPAIASSSLIYEGIRARANPKFLRLVVDIVGLRHYQDSHLRSVGLACRIYGQDVRGDLDFQWVYEDYKSVLTSVTGEGAAARMYEEQERVQLQRRISLLARRWALSTQSAILRERHQDALALHNCLSQRARDVHEESLQDGRDLWKEACAIYSLLHAGITERETLNAVGDKAFERARETLDFWERGAGRRRLLPRANDPEMYRVDQ
ncbi:unnamed protein product [Peniophora sp. CBMAI 1063]|nr:unnamed protein product [Peniophora sp. CBMAI 1063]